MTIASFETRVSRAIKRGTVFDADIPGYAKDAVVTLENIHNWRLMWQELTVVILQGTKWTNLTFLAPWGIKSIRYCQEIVSSERYRRLKKVTDIEIEGISPKGTAAEGFMLVDVVGDPYLEVDAIMAEPTSYRVGMWIYSGYDDDLGWLVRDEGLLLAQTILEMSPLLKDDKVGARYGPIVEAKIQLKKDNEQEYLYDGSDNSMLPFADDIDEWIDDGSNLNDAV